ncbi:serine hydrolase domain-containing protein [Jiella mangrovi]|uniref:Beta-lactamase family protein n=1 Tax=Jiella mangrovi TaxID=2821407 RepID=A0ABS4BF23_9HYPH|nr:serine hydrolase domain-containing protein [Jiella mangrovi]MBP0615360.1 beta-lactamase family protein [Jiella mangrovi]
MTEDGVHGVSLDGYGRAAHVGRTDAVFAWWSFTKTILAIAALRLCHEQRLSLDTPFAGQPYTLRHLLQHRAGVPDYFALAAYHAAVARREPAWPRQKLLAATGSDQLEFAPGTGWRYSNVGYLFVRDAIEAATGSDLNTALEELVFGPLGLRRTRVARGPADLACVHGPSLRGYDPGWVYHGCVTGPATEAAAILATTMSGRLLRADSLAIMLERHELGGAIEGRPWTSHGYGLGLMIGTMAGAGRAIGHSGGGPEGVCAVYHFPDLREPRTIAAFTGGTDEGRAEWSAARLALGA